MADNCEDDELILQATWAMARALRQPATRAALLREPRALPYLADLAADDACAAVRALAAAGLDAVADAAEAGSCGAEEAVDGAGSEPAVDYGGSDGDGDDGGWAQRLRALRFEAHNHEWLAAVCQADPLAFGGGSGDGDATAVGDELEGDDGDGGGAQQHAAGGNVTWRDGGLERTLARPRALDGCPDDGASAGEVQQSDDLFAAAGGGGGGGAVDYGIYAAGGQQLVLDVAGFQLQAEEEHQAWLEQEQEQQQQQQHQPDLQQQSGEEPSPAGDDLDVGAGGIQAFHCAQPQLLQMDA